MAYVLYENLGGPDDVLSKIRDFLLSKDFTILNNCTADLDINGSGSSDGKVLAVKKNDIYAVFRSANGKVIFDSQQNSQQAYGIGLIGATNYTVNPPSGKWFDQPNATVNNAQQVIGAGIPVKQNENYRLWCNYAVDAKNSTYMVMISLELQKGLFQHLAFGETQKVGAWTGGMLVSGSKNSYTMFPTGWSVDELFAGSNHLFGMSANPSTFLRIDVDAAPLRLKPVLWAAAGPASGVCSTGKILATPLTNLDAFSAGWFPKVPHYAYLQSQSVGDYGRNVNTANCISVNLPIVLYIQRDPDSLMNFSQVGYVSTLYSISMRNVASTSCYEIAYPKSGNLHQVFPHVKRAGMFGYDGLSIMQ